MRVDNLARHRHIITIKGAGYRLKNNVDEMAAPVCPPIGVL